MIIVRLKDVMETDNDDEDLCSEQKEEA